jgi:hypothetical protein
LSIGEMSIRPHKWLSLKTQSSITEGTTHAE